jgi:hypothetical protein
MTMSSKILTGIIGFLLAFGLGTYTGYRIFSPKPGPTETINAQAILTALHDQGFLVTQTFMFDTPVTIDRSSGNAFKDFFFGQTIEARGTMEVNLGTDLAKITQDDVTIDDGANTITIHVPASSLFNTRLVGPIQLKNRQGVLKRLIDSDDGYNDALSALSKAAETTAEQPELLKRADDHAKEDVSRLVGYVAKGKTVKVEVK